jgi:molybdopterin-guanine dinucleotide biosynthesis protein A
MIKKEIFGLILVGGKSKRMQKDKALLDYHGKTQAQHSFQLLHKVCNKTFLSLNEEQENEQNFSEYPCIADHENYKNTGPLGGIISALIKFPNQACLTIACDLPFLTKNTLENLLDKRDTQKIATAYTSANDSLPEPLCTIYEPEILAILIKYSQNKMNCPRKILINEKKHVKLIELPKTNALNNVNNPDEFKKAKELIESSHG